MSAFAGGMTLVQFLEQVLLSKEDWQTYQRLKIVPLPNDLRAIFERDHAIGSSGKAVQERDKLENKINEKILAELASGKWRISGAPVNGGQFRDLDPREFSAGKFFIELNMFGPGYFGDRQPSSGWRDIRLIGNDASLARWLAPAEQLRLPDHMAKFLEAYADGDGPKMTREQLQAAFTAQAVQQHGIHANAVSSNAFKKAFSKVLPKGHPRKLTGRPKSI
ncbi:MAG: hypothetical protein EON58_00340 [Alphaproteobacteria bacterium]|nr:MAG: hypothetical protein EON58_00340 [Alphaproteobacteria bacterium]